MPHKLKFFAHYIESELGIVYSESNLFQLKDRLQEIARSLQLQSVEELYLRAQAGIRGPMKQLILDIATNNETLFFSY
jgi:chemotaxis methyl-accepting protein methylase